MLGLAASLAVPVVLLHQTVRAAEPQADTPSDASRAEAAAPSNTLVTMPLMADSSDSQPVVAADTAGKDVEALYMRGRSEYRKGDWVAARRDLTAALDGGYRPGLFEESPASILAKMDAKERADAAQAASVAKPAPSAKANVVLVAQNNPAPTTKPTAAASPAPTPTPETPAAAPRAATPAPMQGRPATPAPAQPVAPASPAPMQAPASAADQALQAAANYDQIKQQQQAYEAQQLVQKARAEQQANQLHEAYQDFNRAATLDPNNQQALAGRDELASRLNLIPAPTVGMNQLNTIPVQIQAIQYAFNNSIANANQAIAQGDFTAARRAIDSARIQRNTNPTIFTQQQLNVMDQTIANTDAALTRAQLQKSEADAAKAARDAQLAQEKRAKQNQIDRERTVAGLIQDARQYIDQGKYREALGVIDHIQALDPTNEYAVSVRMFIEDKANFQEQREHREAFEREFTRQLNDTEERKIPYDDIVRYSDKWPEISAMRDKEVAEDRGENTEDQALQALLDRRLPELRFNANGFSDVIDFLRDVTGANIYVDWPALERASISRDAPVTARLRDIKFSKALELIFKSVEGEEDDRKLGYTLGDGVITISTRKELNKNVVTQRYDINDLLFVAPDYNDAPTLSLQQNQQSGGGGAGGGGGGGGNNQQQNLFQQTNTNQNQNGNEAGGTREERIDEIKKYIVDNVATNTWKDNGGDVGSISSSPLRAVLLITQTPENQRAITKVLDSLRASQALQVSIETRFLVVQRNYLEDIGVNADFEFNPLKNPNDPTSGVWSSHFSPIPVTHSAVTDNSTFRDANGNVVPSNVPGASRTLDWQSNVGNASVPGSIAANPGDYPNPLVIQGSYMDNFTVNFLVRAVEANQKTTSLTAPRLTLFSGQRAEIIVETQQAYVSDLTPVVAPGVGLFDPTVSTTVASGVVLSVLATVSPDRKYVYLDLQPQLARLRALVPFSISAVVQPVTVGNGQVGQTQIVNGTLQLPTIDTTVVKTSVSCPDGATLLLGGQTLAGETEREQGVPVLSKIPFLKRLFTNRASSQDEQILLILVKPTILIQHEQEQKQFPLLSSKVGT